MVIPREANMVRLYIQIASSTDKDFDPRKTATVKEVQAAAKKILKPYYLEWDRVEWYSVYPIGQGIAEKYTLDHRIFMGGDVCHTHSPKAGQGMNTAFHDAINMAWKIHHVESGFADRSILETYEIERKHVAEMLLEFDNKYAALFSKRQPTVEERQDAQSRSDKDAPKNEFVEMFKASCEFTSGYGVAYNPNVFNWSPDHPYQHPLLSPSSTREKLRPGRIMPPSNVTRVADANVVHLENEIPFNGSFRLFIFQGLNHHRNKTSAIADLATALQEKSSFLTRFSSRDCATDNHHESHNPHSPFFSVALIIPTHRPKVEVNQLHQFYQDYSGHIYADDIWSERVPDAQAAAHAKVGLEDEGGVVVVRPDGHIGCVVALTEGNGTYEALEGYFASFTVRPEKGTEEMKASSGLGGQRAIVRSNL